MQTEYGDQLKPAGSDHLVAPVVAAPVDSAVDTVVAVGNEAVASTARSWKKQRGRQMVAKPLGMQTWRYQSIKKREGTKREKIGRKYLIGFVCVGADAAGSALTSSSSEEPSFKDPN